MSKTSRAIRRAHKADIVCREVRYQIVTYGMIKDYDVLYKYLENWMKEAKADKYIRPDGSGK